MGYLGEVFDEYYNSINKKQKIKIREGFKKILWSSLPYIKLIRFFKYKVSYKNIKNEKVLNIFEKYKYIEYKVLKSRYNINLLEKEDLIKARINSNYGKYFDKEIYFKKEYYRALAQYKNIYFNYLKGKVTNLEEEISNNDKLVKELKQKSLKYKYNMEWINYKDFINICLDKIFNTYKPIEVKIKEGNFIPNHILDWDEDNYIVGYVNKSLNGYLKDCIKLQNNFYNKNKWNHNLVKYLSLENINNKYTLLQLCIGKYYKNSEDLLKIKNDNINKLTIKQKELLKKIKKIIKIYNNKYYILFNNYGIPCINESFISKIINKPQRSLNMMIKSINNNINKNNQNIYCLRCGKTILKKSNRTKYCPTCAREIEKENKLKCWNKNKEKYRKY